MMMDILKLTNHLPLEAIEPLKKLKSLSPARHPELKKISPADHETQQKIKLAKNFESILLTRLMEEMKNTIIDWGNEHDSVSQQMHGLFWLCLAQDVGDKGGLGLWHDIYQHFEKLESGTAGNSLDSHL